MFGRKLMTKLIESHVCGETWVLKLSAKPISNVQVKGHVY